MYEIGEKKFFSSHTEAKIFLLSKVKDLLLQENLKAATRQKLTNWYQIICLEIERHSNDIKNITHSYSLFSTAEKTQIASFIPQALIERIEQSPYGCVPNKVLNEDMLLRAYETALPTAMLLNPTPAMKTSAMKLSAAIIKQIELYRSHRYDYHSICKAQRYAYPKEATSINYFKYFKKFATTLLHNLPDKVHLGGFALNEVNPFFQSRNIPVLAESFKRNDDLNASQVDALLSLAISTLRENSDIERVLYIQFMYSWVVMRFVPLFNANSAPNRIFAKLIQKQYQNLENFRNVIARPNKEGSGARSLLFEHIFKSPYYKADKNFGRDGPIDHKQYTRYYGIFSKKNINFLEQKNPSFLTPSIRNIPWTPDAVSQKINYDSVIVVTCLQNEAIFISGPSGTFSLLMAAFEMLVDSSTLMDKQIYLQSVLAYIVGTGLHSIDEVLGPAQITMGLISDYQVDIPTMQSEMKPPNFDAFYELACHNDPDVIPLRKKSWETLLHFYERFYLMHVEAIPNERLFKWIMNKDDISHDKKVQVINLLLENNVHCLADGDSLLNIAIRNRSENIIEILRLSSHANYQDNLALLTIYDNVNMLNQAYQKFEIGYDLAKKSFWLEAKMILDKISDDYIPFDLSECQDEINQFFRELGLGQLISKMLAQSTHEIYFDADQSAKIFQALKSKKIGAVAELSDEQATEIKRNNFKKIR